jgi:hypothetical protein
MTVAKTVGAGPMRLAFGTRGVQAPVVIRWANATNQLPARYVRWRLTFPSGFTYITFRVVLGLNQAAGDHVGTTPGLRLRRRAS